MSGLVSSPWSSVCLARLPRRLEVVMVLSRVEEAELILLRRDWLLGDEQFFCWDFFLF